MPQIFTRSADSWLRLGLTALAGLIPAALAVLAFTAVQPTDFSADLRIAEQQPVPFSHRHHAGELGIACVNCHVSAETAASAGLPPTQTCMACHSQIWTAAEPLAPVRESLLTDTPIAWNRVHDLPDFVYFNHSVHVGAGVPCATCHGDVTDMALIQQVEPMTMRWCLDCHRDPEGELVPLDRVYDPDPHADPHGGETGRLVSFMAAARVQSPGELDSCNVCHR
ncbi:MAG: cytochrome c3 family protein [Oceanicaulis sp.]